MGEEKPIISPTESIDHAGRDFDRLTESEQVMRLLASQQQAVASVMRTQDLLAQTACAVINRLRDGRGRLIYTGAGCSIRIGVQDGVELVPTFGWPSDRLAYLIAGGSDALAKSVEGAEDDRDAAHDDVLSVQIHDSDVVIGIAASGNTPFTCAVLAASAARGALTVAVTSNPAGELVQIADHAVVTETGAEVLAGSTRLAAGTAQKVALNVLSTTVMTGLGRVLGNEMLCVQATNDKLRDRQVRILRGQIERLDALAATQLLESTGWDLRQALLVAKGWSLEAAREALTADVRFRDLFT